MVMINLLLLAVAVLWLTGILNPVVYQLLHGRCLPVVRSLSADLSQIVKSNFRKRLLRHDLGSVLMARLFLILVATFWFAFIVAERTVISLLTSPMANSKLRL